MSASHTVPGTTDPQLRVDFYLDLICPWCWIGLRNLRTAWAAVQAQQPGTPLQIHWHASSLLPQIPDAGVDYTTFYEARLGGPQAVAARRAQVRAAAQAVGLVLNHGAITVFPNSRKACALVNAAQAQLATEPMLDFVESVFAAYFQQGRNLGDAQELLALAQAAGVAVDGAALPSSAAGSTPGHGGGVPYFVFNQRSAETGAVPPEYLLRHMLQAVQHG